MYMTRNLGLPHSSQLCPEWVMALALGPAPPCLLPTFRRPFLVVWGWHLWVGILSLDLLPTHMFSNQEEIHQLPERRGRTSPPISHLFDFMRQTRIPYAYIFKKEKGPDLQILIIHWLHRKCGVGTKKMESRLDIQFSLLEALCT